MQPRLAEVKRLNKHPVQGGCDKNYGQRRERLTVDSSLRQSAP